ncbi:hypothetical protein GALMADRAFT_140460 [Galerina marginata CBS 339.88]|uniref:Ribonuclease H1 N-terminal domain-containing protein n=1 Tax=Galerina marginata (strain CBS 339.88) TaxID=685588 RepID=A0A067T0M8_GALM3|nr:hypothetical protein GALMADRAFT_140460 [Galerina marginata CBS 339.88]
MAKKKWYVVTVGKDVGVFETWLEAGPLVKGIPDALHQSFPTEEQARRVFAQEMLKGNTRVVGANERVSPRQPVVRNSIFPNGGTASPGMSSIVLNGHHLPQNLNSPNHSGRLTTANSNYPSSTAPSPIRVNSQRPISRTSSEPSSRSRRYEIIDALFKDEPDGVGVEARASINHAQASTPTTNVTGLYSPSTETQLDMSREVIVKTPTWLTSYPQRKARQLESQPLSPLDSIDMPLNAFISDYVSERPAVAKRASMDTVSHPGLSPIPMCLTKSTKEEFVGESSISASPHQNAEIVYKHDVDPRSPIMNKTQVPELAFVRWVLPYSS